MKNVLVGQSGGPTSVINSSVLGALEAALDNPSITRVFGMAHGIKGLLNDDLYDIDKEDREELLKLTASELTSTAQVLASAVHLRQQVETAEFTRAIIEQQKAAQQPPGGPLAC